MLGPFEVCCLRYDALSYYGAFLLAILASIPNTKINRKDNPGD